MYPTQHDTQPSAALAHRRAWRILAPAGKQALAGSTNSRGWRGQRSPGVTPSKSFKTAPPFPTSGTTHRASGPFSPDAWQLGGFCWTRTLAHPPAARTPGLIRTGGGGGGVEQELSQSSYPLWVLRAAGGKEPSVAQKNSSVAVSRLRPGCTLLFPFSFSLLSSLLPSANTSLSWVTSPDSLTSCFVETQLLGALLD